MAGIPGPKHWIKRELSRPYWYDGAIALISLLAALYTAFSSQQYFLATCSLVICLFSLAKIAVTRKGQKDQESVHDLEGCLHTLHAVLTGDLLTNFDPRLRITVHVECEGRLQQVIDYVGDRRGRPGGVGRSFPTQSGIIGKVFQKADQDIVRGQRVKENYEEYIKELKNEWNYVDGDARSLDPAAMAWMAIALRDAESKLLGIVFMDCISRIFFTEEVAITSIYACSGIARFIGKRYK